jgi:hypothetical protein
VRRSMFFVVLPLLAAGCQLFDDLKDAVDELTQPVLMQVVYIGMEEPEDAGGLDLEGTEMDAGATLTAVIYDVDITTGGRPGTGASVTLLSSHLSSVGLAEDGEGVYSADAGDGLDYRALDDVEVVADFAGVRRRIAMRTPVPATANISEDHTSGVALSVDLRGQGFDNAVVILVDLTPGDVGTVWESEVDPTSPKDPENLTQTIPGDSFEDGRIYVVGIVGLKAADESGFEELQALGSGMLAGTMVLFPVSTLGEIDTGSW